jgi:hypothetical protein
MIIKFKMDYFFSGTKMEYLMTSYDLWLYENVSTVCPSWQLWSSSILSKFNCSTHIHSPNLKYTYLFWAFYFGFFTQKSVLQLIYHKKNNDRYKRWITRHKTSPSKKQEYIKDQVGHLVPWVVQWLLKLGDHIEETEQRKGSSANTFAKQGFEDSKSHWPLTTDLVLTERISTGGILQWTQAYNYSPSQ